LNRRNFRIARVLGIPIEINPTWVITMVFVTSLLALQIYPEVLPPSSPYRNDVVLHWLMALCSGIVFFASVLLHELAHSIVAKSQGIPVKAITLFIFGGVSQIAGEARRPLHEFLIAIVGPLMSLLLAGIFFVLLWATGLSPMEDPLAIVLEWLILMNLVVAAFNMAPGFPLDGGRVLRSVIWGISGNLVKATRFATIAGRALGYSLMFIGGLAIFNLIDFIDPWSALWFGILGLFLESSARQSWFQTRALEVLSKHKAATIMTSTLETARRDERVQYLVNRGGRHFLFFVTDNDESVAGVLTERETAPFQAQGRLNVAAEDIMIKPGTMTTARLTDDAAAMLQSMEAASVWHLPVIDDGQVIGVVSKEDVLRLLARDLMPRQRLAERP
jgi:Zn-dependent protease/CBS domain-containing protein